VLTGAILQEGEWLFLIEVVEDASLKDYLLRKIKSNSIGIV
jgi:hypothetical protein